MLYTIAAYYLEYRLENNIKIKPKGTPLHILIVKLDFDRYRQFIPPVDLRPASQSRYQRMNTPISPERH